MSIITRLPYELLHSVSDSLDTQTLLNLALANRRLNEPASWALYKHLVVNPDYDKPLKRIKKTRTSFSSSHKGKVPFVAFERRPHLRNAAQELLIYSPCKFGVVKEPKVILLTYRSQYP
jgi:hypothetical protein